jgi:hypothetical protein
MVYIEDINTRIQRGMTIEDDICLLLLEICAKPERSKGVVELDTYNM